ncbi:HAD-like domain [Pseudocohnilembus persalinus]|uniref:HAD-like domain n=1 Tax=Pseudocohnilembus persalinus TaxID=266149 RepID=A0A0V0QCV6_PSEPJ|nr:HAD-like domain [Pseudocohnilembus persalinus]|eukprot:KRX00058.1 HAD-like domain [Pseudocohnilembus persalinus]
MQQQQKDKKLPQVPGVIIDIDGVLIKGKEGIQRSREGLELLSKTFNELNGQKFGVENRQKIQFTTLTNCGGNLEKNHAEIINQKMGIEREEFRIKAEETILNFTPLRAKISEFVEAGKLICVGGSLNYLDIVEDMGIQLYITFEEFAYCFPFVLAHPNYEPEVVEATRKRVAERLGLGEDYDWRKTLQVHGMFLLYEPECQEICIQVIMDLCTTEDGRISEVYPFEKPKEHIPLYIVNNDLVYKDAMPLPRLAFGSFNLALQTCAKKLHNMDLNITFYGKPQPVAFEYATEHIRNKNKEVEISNFYMIGDNPQSDIKGANEAGIISILVKTGVYQGEEPPTDIVPKYFVNDFYDAIQLIMKLEGIIE